MKKYKVEFIQKETFSVDVFAKNKQEAIDKANEKFGEGNYSEVGDCNVDIGKIKKLKLERQAI